MKYDVIVFKGRKFRITDSDWKRVYDFLASNDSSQYLHEMGYLTPGDKIEAINVWRELQKPLDG